MRLIIMSEGGGIAVRLALVAALAAGCTLPDATTPASKDSGTGSDAVQGSGGNNNPGSGGAPGTGDSTGAGGSGATGGNTGSGGVSSAGGEKGTGGAAGSIAVGGRGVGRGGAGGGGGGGGTGGATAIGGAGGGSAACNTGMVPIPAKDQSFMMGLDASEAPLQANGMPWACYLGKHQVTFTYNYCMDANLVTQADFSKLMGFNPSMHKTADLTLPVDAETWYDAILYCNKKSQIAGLEPAYSYGAVTLNGMSASNIAGVVLDIKKNGYRLPTNAEYEYAERANTTGLYFFSPTQTSNITALGAVYAWYSVNSTGVSQPVGRLKPNPWGLYDIVGNLFEWEHDWEGPYVTTPEVDPVGPAVGTGCGGFGIGIQRMAKGGSWHTDVATHMRISYHYKWTPASVHPELGFRCVATVK